MRRGPDADGGQCREPVRTEHDGDLDGHRAPPFRAGHIRKSPLEDQHRHFDAGLADTEIEALPEMPHRWVTLSDDGFEEFLLSQPFDGLEFGARSCDEQTDAE